MCTLLRTPAQWPCARAAWPLHVCTVPPLPPSTEALNECACVHVYVCANVWLCARVGVITRPSRSPLTCAVEVPGTSEHGSDCLTDDRASFSLPVFVLCLCCSCPGLCRSCVSYRPAMRWRRRLQLARTVTCTLVAWTTSAFRPWRWLACVCRHCTACCIPMPTFVCKFRL